MSGHVKPLLRQVTNNNELTSDMRSMDVSNWLILTRSVKALVWVSLQL
jgi:Flp pilus assembly protein protease CpaA